MPSKTPVSWEMALFWLFFVGFGLFAGIAKFASDVYAGKISYSKALFFCQLIISMFAGWCGGVLCLSVGAPDNVVWLGAGLAGYAGTTLLNMLWRFFFESRFGIKEKKDE